MLQNFGQTKKTSQETARGRCSISAAKCRNRSGIIRALVQDRVPYAVVRPKVAVDACLACSATMVGFQQPLRCQLGGLELGNKRQTVRGRVSLLRWLRIQQRQHGRRQSRVLGTDRVGRSLVTVSKEKTCGSVSGWIRTSFEGRKVEPSKHRPRSGIVRAWSI